MKQIITTICILIFYHCPAQNFEAEYQMEMILSPDAQGFMLPFKINYYSKENTAISYVRPQYFNLYPSNTVTIKGKSYALWTDSILAINYFNFDSLYHRVFEFGYELRPYDTSYYHYKILDETKIINGLLCRKATWTPNRPDAKSPYAEFWYCPDIPMKGGIMGNYNLPGLIVEFDYYNFYTAKLINYSFPNKIADDIFWPKEFNATPKDRIHKNNLSPKQKAEYEKKIKDQEIYKEIQNQ